MLGIRSVMVVAGVWLLSAPASAAYVPAAVMCAPGGTRETDAILPTHLYNRTRRHSHLEGLSPEQFEAAHKTRRQRLH